ncbi:MAG: hypothetical protein ACE5O2_06450 [Armatimonadota bacterium]
MLKIRCPNCGTNLYEGYFTFPRCHKCNANALCCRACVSYDAVRGVCIEPTSPIDTVQDPDQMPQCGIFKPQLVVEHEADRPFGRRFWLYVAAGVVAVLLAFAVVIVRMQAATRPRQVVASIMEPSEIAADRPAPFTILVTNNDSDSAHDVSIRLPEETLARWDAAPGAPLPLEDEMRGSTRYLVYEVAPAATTEITIYLRAHDIGQSRTRIEVVDHRGRPIALLSERLDVTP